MLRRLLDSRWFYFALAALLFAIGLASMVEIRTPDRPTGSVADIARLKERKDLNVVFLLIDTLRADRLSSYGYHRPTSPILDQLAATGIRFSRVTAQSSWTKTSMTSLWTATYPVSHGVLRSQHGIPPEATLPAEIFRDAGYRTAGIYRNGWVAPNFGFEQGFEVYIRPVPSNTPERMTRRTASSLKLSGSDEDIFEGAKEFLQGVRNERFFLYLHYMDVHQYVYSDVNFGPSFSDAYDSAIHWVDRNVGALVTTLQDLGLADRTILVIAADHGEGFREHEIEGHARTLYTEVIDTPLIIALPFHLREGIVVEERVENIDIWPTVLEMLGLAPLPGAQGVSLLPAIEAAANGPKLPAGELRNWGGRTHFAQLDRTWGTPDAEPRNLVAVTDGPWRFFSFAHNRERVELYDHRTDPGEKNDLSASHREVVDSLQSKLSEYLDLPGVTWGQPVEVQLDRLRLEQLRALGYEVGAPEDQGNPAMKPLPKGGLGRGAEKPDASPPSGQESGEEPGGSPGPAAASP